MCKSIRRHPRPRNENEFTTRSPDAPLSQEEIDSFLDALGDHLRARPLADLLQAPRAAFTGTGPSGRPLLTLQQVIKILLRFGKSPEAQFNCVV
jgi:hypothetical protein